MPNIAQAVRGVVKLSGTLGGVGTVITGWTSAEVDNTSYTNADTFSVTFAASRLPPGFDESWFSAQTDMYASIQIGVPPDPSSWVPTDLPDPWIYGRVDKIKYCPFKRTVSIEGRDLSALLIDSKTTEKFENKTASQVATILAKRHGLTPIVTATTTPVGKYYAIDHETMTDSQTEWNLLWYLARHEQYRVRVRGQSLYFEPLVPIDSSDLSSLKAQLASVNSQISAQNIQIDALNAQAQSLDASGNTTGAAAIYNQQAPIASNVAFVLVPQRMALEKQISNASGAGVYPIRVTPPDSDTGYYSANVEDLDFERDLMVSRGVKVVMRCFNDAQGKVLTAVYPTSSSAQSPSPGTAGKPTEQTYYYTLHNETQQSLNQKAQAKYQQIVRHEMKMTCELPGDSLLDVNMQVTVTGTDTAFDQTYYPESIKRSLDFDSGYRMSLDAKNQNPDSNEVS